MATSGISRRALLQRGVLLGAGITLLGACGSDSDDGADADAGAATSTSADGGDHAATVGLVPAIVSSDLYASATPQRFAFTVRTTEGEFSAGEPARVALAPVADTPERFVRATPRFEGLPEFRGVYSTDAVLATEGAWRGILDYDGEQIDFSFAVKPEPQMPAPGSAAPRVASPTPARTYGVEPLCTRDPACSLHDRSLKDLIGSGTPVAVLFGTPARCQTAYCGPVLDAMLPLVDEYPDVAFVHVDIFKASDSEEVSPTVRAWGLQSEPWMFTIDGRGTIVGRLDGAFDTTEMREQLDALPT